MYAAVVPAGRFEVEPSSIDDISNKSSFIMKNKESHCTDGELHCGPGSTRGSLLSFSLNFVCVDICCPGLRTSTEVYATQHLRAIFLKRPITKPPLDSRGTYERVRLGQELARPGESRASSLLLTVICNSSSNTCCGKLPLSKSSDPDCTWTIAHRIIELRELTHKVSPTVHFFMNSYV